jgi:hypothetical protein
MSETSVFPMAKRPKHVLVSYVKTGRPIPKIPPLLSSKFKARTNAPTHRPNESAVFEKKADE